MLEYKYHPPVYHFYNHKTPKINGGNIPEMLLSINHRITTIDLKMREHMLNDLLPEQMQTPVKPSYTECIIFKKILENILKHYKKQYKNLLLEKEHLMKKKNPKIHQINDINRKINYIAYNIDQLVIKIEDKKIMIHTADEEILGLVKKETPTGYKLEEI